jgi:hypothetical protein
MVDLILEDGQSFMRNGKNVGILFGFKEPTQINLHYYIEHNNFTLTTIPPTAEDDEMYVSDTDDYTLREYDNDRHYGWEHIIRDTKSQVEVSYNCSFSKCYCLSLDIYNVVNVYLFVAYSSKDCCPCFTKQGKNQNTNPTQWRWHKMHNKVLQKGRSCTN